MRRLASLAILFASLPLAALAEARIAERHPPRDVQRPSSPLIGDSRQRGPRIGREVGDIRNRIERARESGALSRREARQLKREARQIGNLARRYGRDGLSSSERAELQARAHYLRDAVNRPRSSSTGSGKRSTP
jgi:hypothetical protein